MTTAKKKIFIADILLLVLLAVVLGISTLWSREIELKLGLLYYADKDTVDEKDIVQPLNGGVFVSADGEAPDGGTTDKTDGLYIHYVDVEQGDCTVIEFPDGKTMIIDAGENKSATETAIQTFIDKTLPDGFEYFDYAILTHPDSDHCGSMDYVLERYPARVSYRPNVEAVGTSSNGYTDPGKTSDSKLTDDAVTKNTAAYAACIKAMYAPTPDFTPTVYVTDPADDVQTITGGTEDNTYTFTFFSPLSQKYTDWNDYSPIMILTYRGYNFALSGDAEKKNEAEFVAKVQAAKTDGVNDKYDIFTDDFTVCSVKCGHHGSRTSTSQGYLDVITTPEGARSAYYIISCGEDNKYGHPHSETLERLKNMNVPEENILRTDIEGDITLSVRRGETVGDDGLPVYGLFHGSKMTKIAETVLVYRTLGGIKLKWTVVAWAVYAVVAAAVIVHMLLVGMGFVGRGDNGKRMNDRGGRRTK